MPLSGAQRKFLIVDQAIGAGIGNLLFNGFATWGFFPGDRLPLWGFPSIGSDLLCTCFGLPWLTALCIGPFVRKAIRDGKLTPIDATEPPPPRLRWVPAGAFHRSWVLGLGAMLAVTPLIMAVLVALGVDSVGRLEFSIAKAVFAAALAAAVAPLCAYFTLREATPNAVVPAPTPVLE